MHNSKALIILFLIICLIPSVLMPLFPSKAAANEVLSPVPKLGIDILNQISDYVGDHFAFRQQFITLWAYLNSSLFKTSVEDKVILGTDGWLYYSQDLGNNMTDDQLEAVAKNIKSLQDSLENEGKSFIFTIAPDKTNLHGSNLPANISNISMGIKIKPFLEKYEINYIDLFDESIPYFKTDSHWTSYGAAIAADKLLCTEYSKKSFDKLSYHKGDLYEMLYPSDSYEEENYLCDLKYETEGNTDNGNAITINTTGCGEKILYCWRDSFGVSLFPYLADATKSATFSRSTTYDAGKCGDADIVILEIVERNLSKLQ